MITGASTSGTEWFLNGIDNTRTQEAITQRQISSGIRVTSAADDPSQIVDLVGLNSSLATNQIQQQSFARVKSEIDSADQVLTNAISVVDSARTLGFQGANTSSSPELRQGIVNQLNGLMQQIISLANTSVQGRYIFSGDTGGVVPYQPDSTSATGYSYQGSSTSTRQIFDASGNSIYTSPTAQAIFDPRDSAGNPTSTNVLAGLQGLIDAMQNNPTAIPDAVSALQTASTYLNGKQSEIGTAQTRMAAALQTATTAETTLKTRISAIRDTDITGAAIDLNTEKVSESAALAAQANMSRKTLFDFLG